MKEQALQLHVRGEEDGNDVDEAEEEEEEAAEKEEMSRLSGRSSSFFLAWFRDPHMLHRDERASLWKVQSWQSQERAHSIVFDPRVRLGCP